MGNDQDFAIKTQKTKGMTFSATPFNLSSIKECIQPLLRKYNAHAATNKRLPQRTAEKKNIHI